MTEVKRTQGEIDEVIDTAQDSGGDISESIMRGMSYEQGIIAMAAWIFGETDEKPFG